MKDTETTDSTGRRCAILDTATRVFLRYGFKKTSMDDLARAAGLSRQGLYLHFSTKEALFKEALTRLVGETRRAGRAALADESRALEPKLLAAFEAVHGSAIGQFDSDHMTELMTTAKELVGASEDDFAAGVVADIVRALRDTPVAAMWKDQGVSTKELAENLYSTSFGIKHRVKTAADYRAQMKIAIQIVCKTKR